MTKKSRMFALAGLVIALAAGTTAVRAWSGRADSCDDAPCHPNGCPALVRKAPHINHGHKAARKKTIYLKKIREENGGCCCAQNKVKANCPCKTPAAACCAPSCCGPVYAPYTGFTLPVPPPYAPPDVMMAVPPPPAPPATPICYPAGNCKQYRVELKLMEQREDEDEEVISSPTLCVCEGQTAQVSAGISHADLCKKNVPQNDMGHEGHEISVVVSPGPRPGCVTLACWLWTSERGQNCGGDPHLTESRVTTTQCVKVGKATKLHCDRVCGHEKVSCWLEVTVKEHAEEGQEQKSVGCPPPPPSMPSCGPVPAHVGCGTVVAPAPIRQSQCIPLQGADGPLQATWVAPAPREVPTKVEFSPRHITLCEVPNPECGKVADAQGPCKVLEVSCQSMKMTSEKMTLTHDNCCPVTVTIQDGKIHVSDGWFEATADSVIQEKPEALKLKGKVKVIKSCSGHLSQTNEVELLLTPLWLIQFEMGIFP